MDRAINFSAGPAMLPESVLSQMQEELFNFDGSGMSIMEVSHRGHIFAPVQEQIEEDLAALLNIPAGYRIILMHGGAQAQFSMIPLNFSSGYSAAPAYIQTGHWGRLAVNAARQYVAPHVIDQPGSVSMPDMGWSIPDDSPYVYMVDNETVNGVEFNHAPVVGEVPLLADMSSNFLSRPFDMADYGMVFACAQKNLGIAGVTVAIISEELLEREVLPFTPPLYAYRNVLVKSSMPNTPATFSWYVMGLVLKWVKAQGGLSVMNQRAVERSELLYKYLDSSSFYSSSVESEARSRMNVPFQLADERLQDSFLKQAEAAGLTHLKGHKSVGGCRASLYNSMTLSGVESLISFMKAFEKQA